MDYAKEGGVNGKKVKCIDCAECSGWSLPVKVNTHNLDYAKHCLYLARNTVVCSYTMKTKPIDHEQYCKHYHEGIRIHRINYSEEIEELQKMIEEFEKSEMG